jgi:hypothetical protein
MALGEIQLGEVVVVGFDVRPFGDGETHVGEDRGELVDHLADRMDAAASVGASRTGRVTSTVSVASRASSAAPLKPSRRAFSAR